MGVGRVFAPGHFDLELEGVSAGPLSNLQGGEAVAEVIEEKAGADHFTHKHVGNVHYNDIVLTFGGGMSKGFYDWIEQATLQNFSQKAGAVITSDPQGKAQRRLEWHGGLLTEIDFPKLDAASKDPFRMTVKITPEHTKSAAGSGNASVVKGQKYWGVNSFKLQIDGLGNDCKWVSKIEAISLKAKTTYNAVGSERDYSKQLVLTQTEPGNLLITIQEKNAKGFQDWFNDFVINGNNTRQNTRSGTLESGLFKLQFSNLGPFKMSHSGQESQDSVAHIMIEMYCESIHFSAVGS